MKKNVRRNVRKSDIKEMPKVQKEFNETIIISLLKSNEKSYKNN